MFWLIKQNYLLSKSSALKNKFLIKTYKDTDKFLFLSFTYSFVGEVCLVFLLFRRKMHNGLLTCLMVLQDISGRVKEIKTPFIHMQKHKSEGKNTKITLQSLDKKQKHLPNNLKIFPANKNLYCSTLQSFQCIINTKTVFASVLADFFKVLACKRMKNVNSYGSTRAANRTCLL